MIAILLNCTSPPLQHLIPTSMNALRSCVALLRQFSGRYLCGLRSCDIIEEFCRGMRTESGFRELLLMDVLQSPVFRLMCIIDPDSRTEKPRDCLGYGRYGGKPPRRRGRRASLAATAILIILTHPLIPAPMPHLRRYSVDWSQSNHKCSVSPQTWPTPTSNNRLLLSSTHPHRRRTYITQFSPSWGSRILGFLTRQSRLQICPTHNLILTCRSCSGTGVFLSLVGVW
jgi:hypothetical protein